jgi:hypothetical protein
MSKQCAAYLAYSLCLSFLGIVTVVPAGVIMLISDNHLGVSVQNRPLRPMQQQRNASYARSVYAAGASTIRDDGSRGG